MKELKFKPLPFKVSPELANDIKGLYRESEKEDKEKGVLLCRVNDNVVMDKKIHTGAFDNLDMKPAIKEGCQVGEMVASLHTHPYSEVKENGDSVTTWPCIEDNLNQEELDEQWDNTLYELTGLLFEIAVKRGVKTSAASRNSVKAAKDIIFQGHDKPILPSFGEASVADIISALLPADQPKILICSITKNSPLFCYKVGGNIDELVDMIPESTSYKDEQGEVRVMEWFHAVLAEQFLKEYMDKHVESYMEQL